MGLAIEDAFVDERTVYGSIPATKGCEKPALGSHRPMKDTAPDTSGRRELSRKLRRRRLATLPGTGMVVEEPTFPSMKELKGETLITTDGTTLLARTIERYRPTTHALRGACPTQTLPHPRDIGEGRFRHPGLQRQVGGIGY